MITIHRLSPFDVAVGSEWDSFVTSRPQATFFHRSAWQRVISAAFRHESYFLFAELNGKMVGILPLAHVKSVLFGNSLVSLPFAVYGGVVADNGLVREELERYAQSLAHKLNVDCLEFRNVYRQHAHWPEQSIYVTFRKNITSDSEVNRLSIPRKQRAMIRKGEKNGLLIKQGSGVDDFFPLYANNVHRHGTPALPRRYFELLKAEFAEDCEFLTVLDSNRQPVSSVLSFYFKNEVLPYYAGDQPRARELAANDFKYWSLMSRAGAREIEVFDFGRSKRGSGSFSFKRNWGFEAQPLHYEFCLYKRKAVPQNNPSNAKFRLLVEAWKRMPLSVANCLGPLVVRSLG